MKITHFLALIKPLNEKFVYYFLSMRVLQGPRRRVICVGRRQQTERSEGRQGPGEIFQADRPKC